MLPQLSTATLLSTAATLCALALGTEIRAQKTEARNVSYNTFTMTRTRPFPYEEVFQFEASAAFGFANDSGDDQRAEEDEETIDGSVWIHSNSFTSNDAELNIYAGRNGAILSIFDDRGRRGSGQRLEVYGRHTSFFREGFYEGDDFVVSGQYRGTDIGAFLGVGDSPADGVYIEAGPWMRFSEFSRTRLTTDNFIIPDNHFAFGGRIYLEQNSLALDRTNGKPRQGYLLTVMVEREQNFSDRTFGSDPTFLSSLPDALWRGRYRLEAYLPLQIGTVELHSDGSLSDEDDRIYNADIQNRAIGQFWVDNELRLRLDFGGGIEIKPFAKMKYQQVRGENGFGTDDDVFFGGGVYLQWSLGDTFDLFADYSFSQDSNRPAISFRDDTLGEHQLFIGGRLKLGTKRGY